MKGTIFPEAILKFILKHCKKSINYIGGNDVLPPPLSADEEKEIIQNISDFKVKIGRAHV